MSIDLDKTNLITIPMKSVAVATADDEYTRIIDNTTDPLYIFISETYLDDAALTDKVYRCARIVNATGTKRWATDSATGKRTRAFIFAASTAATLTY